MSTEAFNPPKVSRRIPRFTEPENPAADPMNLSTSTRNRESRNEKFIRVGNPRIKRAIHALRWLGNLGGPNYERTPEQVDKIGTVLVAELEATMHRLRQGMESKIEDIL